MGFELKGREIFAVGTWNGMEFTEEDLDDIVQNFERLREEHRVPLKFGHNEDQEITDGQPAIGWVERIFKQGNKLFADFTHMPKTVFEAIKNKLYRTVSIELLFNVDKDGKKYNHVLDAVALLGADQPAVSSLADLDALLATRTEFNGGRRVAFETTAGTSKKFKSTKREEFTMDDAKVKELIAESLQPLKDANEELRQQVEAKDKEIAQFKREKAEAEETAKKAKIKLARDAVTEVLDSAVKQKNLTPAQREVFEKQIGFTNDERIVEINVEELKTMFSVKPPKDGQQGEEDGVDEFDNPEAKLMELTNENMAKTGSDDFQANFMRTCRANPKLHKAYLDANGVKS